VEWFCIRVFGRASLWHRPARCFDGMVCSPPIR